ncbi:MAG: S41 family peptidase [Proteobacteria bacterium]|nr:S41 family peptidase [Pseudomonadota bacterium]
MKTILLTVLLFIVQYSSAEDKWYITDTNNFGFYLTTKIQNNEITGHTRKNALKNIVGWAKYTLIKLTTSISSPEIIHLDGTIKGNKIVGKYHNLFQTTSFTGEINENSIQIILNYSKSKQTILNGTKVASFRPKRNYTKVFQQIFALTEKNLYQQSFLKSKHWIKFKKKMLEIAPGITDDLELQIAFYAYVRNFPFSHYQLIKKPHEVAAKNAANDSSIQYAKLTEIDAKTVVLDIDQFKGSKQSMDDFIAQIETKEYQNLIIDLRDNPGGNFISMHPLAQYLISKPLIAGVFPNQRWYKERDGIPNKEDYILFSEFSGGTMAQWMELASQKYGIYYKIYPSQKHFTGNVFILTNNNTASTSEPFVYGLKHDKIATIVGESTMGAMLSMNTFEIDNNILLGIPLNDYITYSGQRIDKAGVTPNIKVASDKALETVLNMIMKQ